MLFLPAKFIGLRKLDLSRNFFTQIPDSISLLSALEELNLSMNRISQLSDVYGCFFFFFFPFSSGNHDQSSLLSSRKNNQFEETRS